MPSVIQSDLFGSPARTRALLSIGLLGETHAAEIADILERAPSRVKDLVDGLEAAGLIIGTQVGTARVLSLNPRYVAAAELRSLIEALGFYDRDLQRRLSQIRRRPRRKGKEV
jgi:DNA-binding MarR family transcriptional regulator